ncbi:hypothetical protein OAP32_00445 [Crocinitomicaceae bacterium]|nr:hypothetical protein [Crocinitomicaceae bacterium]
MKKAETKTVYKAILHNNDGTILYNHGDGRGLVLQPFDPKTGQPIRTHKSTALYRHFDRNGVLLYIGISMSAMARMCQHNHASYMWTDDIATMTIDWLESREQALEAEKAAIIAEKPMYNIVHNRCKE